MCMIAWEVLGHALPTAARPEDVASNAAVASLEVAPPATLALPSSPKLVAANNQPRAGSIPKIMTAALEPAAGKRVELEEVFAAYADACHVEGKRAVPPGRFVEPLRKFCKAAGIRIKDEGGHVYLMNVRIAGQCPPNPNITTAGIPRF